MVVLSVALCRHSLQFIVIEGLSQTPNPYWKHWISGAHIVKRRKLGEDALISGIFRLLANRSDLRRISQSCEACATSRGAENSERRFDGEWENGQSISHESRANNSRSESHKQTGKR
jgi:hypothetical protein